MMTLSVLISFRIVLNYRSVFYLIGILLSIIAVAMIAPSLVELLIYRTDDWQEFALGALITGSLGSLLALSNHSLSPIELKVKDVFFLTTLCWVTSSFFAAFPIYWSNLNIEFIDAWFEAVSALTTTGATIITHLDNAPRGVLLWRAILQWLGGTGIVLMAITILPILRIGGMQLFRSEFSDRSEKILPRVSQIGTAIISTYILLTFCCGTALLIAGMHPFDAACHAMSTVSTGGLSTHDASIGFYKSISIEMIVSFFMILGGITFILYIKIWQGEFSSFLKDSQVKLYLFLIFMATLAITIWNIDQHHFSIAQSLRQSSFTVISMISSTGFTTSNYVHWGPFPLIIITILSLLGGCTGSTSGGIKVFRLQILGALAISHLRQLRRPHGVFLAIYNGQKIPEIAAASVFTFVTLYFFSVFFLTASLSLCGLDLLNSFSAAIASIGNTGPGITDLIGPQGNFAPLSKSAKVVVMFGMLLGRLELLTVLVLFMPSFWRR
jgi:trk system potassium uptake protein